MNTPTPDPRAIRDRAQQLKREVFNATAAANNPDMAYPDWPDDVPLPDLAHREDTSEAAYYQYLAEHREYLERDTEFRNGYELLDWLTAEGADLRDYQTWSCDPEEPLRRSDRHRSR
ncbi:hypothetical protein ACFQZZ_14890 [Nocardia sp. GCM10030253]|uniref:hypothetical protein n=1 Tax=Nocardia sp. GCM10030253 TaxID=3273404 RepID=UPI003644C99D